MVYCFSPETTTTTTTTAATTEKGKTSGAEGPEIPIRTEKTSFGGAQFRIEENFDNTINGNIDEFQVQMVDQIAGKLDVKPDDIVVIVEKGKNPYDKVVLLHTVVIHVRSIPT